MQFGDVVMRNLYTLYDFGSFTRPQSNAPFIQILSVSETSYYILLTYICIASSSSPTLTKLGPISTQSNLLVFRSS